MLLSLGAKLDASNNAGDRAYHWAENMDHKDVMELLVKVSFLSVSLSQALSPLVGGAAKKPERQRAGLA